MAGITLAIAEAQLVIWLAASEAVATGQSYSIKDRSLTRANAAEIREQIKFWDGLVKSISASASGRGRTRYVVPE